MLPKGFKCYFCGECCKAHGFEIAISQSDTLRWKKEKREDILSRVIIMIPELGVGDAWFDPITGGELDECPWLEKISDKNYVCKIENTKPEECRDWPDSLEKCFEFQRKLKATQEKHH